MRTSSIKRETRETNINLEMNLDGCGDYEICTGNRIFDHLLSQLSKHSLIDITLSATGDDIHHLVEDVAICMGKALCESLEDKRGITRMADASVPMDESLAFVAVDLSGRGYSVLDMQFNDNDMFGFPTDLVRHFLETLAIEAKMNLHARVVYGTNDHHKAEGTFKALGRALGAAIRIDPRMSDELPSTKGQL
ncbi:MAG: imidazoleglycerol-phosphate dehydratase HisB [Dehalococcoidales bacterium]|mgnify:FL=1|jgi:imidazoleglycerol-phosphate dehydratase|nr:imidazoleglycerol-phosphate dehydratase HisB [Dehalococcoidales bacterium]MDD3994455.1 imidazoleglycerol-phosphate dehydratase HisB [Dehalococcoidales bacterium]NLT27826.1 imidazoleglycerol-phosphate dehydratase HisB [Dehalococcoidales bacterium]